MLTSLLEARNSDLWPFLDSMRQMEDRFNHWAQYDYVFLNEEVSLAPETNPKLSAHAVIHRLSAKTSNGWSEAYDRLGFCTWLPFAD